MVVAGAALFAGVACKASTDEPPGPDTWLLPQNVGVLVVESQYEGTGWLQVIDPETHGLVDQYGTGYDADPQLRRVVDPRDGTERLFIVGATDGKLTQIDRRGHLVGAWDVNDPGEIASAADPRDVAIAPDGALWVTRYKKSSLLVLEPDGTKRATVPLDAFTPSNGPSSRAPGMSAISIVHGVAYVALQRLDEHFKASNVSQVVTIDTTVDAKSYRAEAFVDLPVADPDFHFTLSLDDPPKLRISCIGDVLFSTPPLPGAVVEIDLAEKNPSARVVLDGRPTHTFVVSFDVGADGYWYVITASDDVRGNPTALQRFDPSSGTLDSPWFSRDSYQLVQVATVADEVLVLDRSHDAPGIQVFDRRDGAHLGEIATHLPPVEMLVVRNQK